LLLKIQSDMMESRVFVCTRISICKNAKYSVPYWRQSISSLSAAFTIC